MLLAGSQYRQQIEADIKPFEGILLGIFFMTAGANLDPGLCLQEWPTLLSGIVAFLGAKLGLIFALGAFVFGLSRAEAIRIALLLAGGATGERCSKGGSQDITGPRRAGDGYREGNRLSGPEGP